MRKKVGVPVENGLLSLHFGHCREFEIVEVDLDQKEVISRQKETAPYHEPGALPKFLKERGVDVIIVGGIGSRASLLFEEMGITVIKGVSVCSVDRAIEDFLNNSLKTGANICDH